MPIFDYSKLPSGHKLRHLLSHLGVATAALVIGLVLLGAMAGRTLHRQWIRVERLQMEAFDRAVEDQGGGIPVEFMAHALQDSAVVYLSYQGPGSWERLVLPPGREKDAVSQGGGEGIRERALGDGVRIREWQAGHQAGRGRKGTLRMAFSLDRRDAEVRAQLGVFTRPALWSALIALLIAGMAAWLMAPKRVPVQPGPVEEPLETPGEGIPKRAKTKRKAD